MIICESYFGSIKFGNKYSFLLATDCKQRLLNSNGSIRLLINDIVVLSEKYWDEIDYLWIEIVDCLEKVLSNTSAVCNFPDQPLILYFNIIDGEHVKLEIENVVAIANINLLSKYYWKML